jgi:hypothetical protein
MFRFDGAKSSSFAILRKCLKENKNINTQEGKTKNFNNENSFFDFCSELIFQNAKKKNNNSARRGAAICFDILISHMHY